MKIEVVGTVFFALALLHAFLLERLKRAVPLANRPSPFLWQLVTEIEFVFALWAGLLLVSCGLFIPHGVFRPYLEQMHFQEALFVFLIMMVSATQPVLNFARRMLHQLSAKLVKWLPVEPVVVEIFIVLTVGPLLGSLFTEPVAMTVSSLLLSLMLKSPSRRVLYSLLAVLFVNVSIGGSLTPFAAPPILMVVTKWGWNFSDVFFQLGVRGICAVMLNGFFFTFYFRRQLVQDFASLQLSRDELSQGWIFLINLTFAGLAIFFVHHTTMTFVLLIGFLLFWFSTKKSQGALRWHESLAIALFLSGLVVLGPFQAWWLRPLLQGGQSLGVYLSATVLTGFVDNAALTFLGSQVEGLSDSVKWALVSGALVGGGLTLMANAPNPIGATFLRSRFEGGQISMLRLMKAALLPTLVALICYWRF